MGGPSDSSKVPEKTQNLETSLNQTPDWKTKYGIDRITDPDWRAKFDQVQSVDAWNAVMKEYQKFADKQNANISGVDGSGGLQQSANFGFYQQGRKATVLTPGQMDLGVTTPGVVSDTDFVKALQGYYNGKKLP